MSEMIKKSFRCNSLYQSIIDKALKVWKCFTTDTDIILYGLRLVRKEMNYNIKVPEDDEFPGQFEDLKSMDVKFTKVTQDDIKQWKKNNPDFFKK